MAEEKREGIRQHLAAILAADVVGYARLMAADERGTIDALNRRRTLFRKHIEANGGRVVDTAGDSVLAMFGTAIGAARAAVAAQDAIAAENAALPEARRMAFRVGLNTGDIHEQDDGTVYGDGVNVAARLQALAEPNGICVSGNLHDEVRGKLDFAFADMCEHEVKNIEGAVRVYALATAAAARPRRRVHSRAAPAAVGVVAMVIALAAAWQAGLLSRSDETVRQPAGAFAPALPAGPSIAVLPFANLSGDPEQDYFSDGLTEDVIAALGRFSNLSVMASNATLPYKSQTVTPKDIGRALGVLYLLAGNVRKSEDRVRVAVQLTDTATGLHLWSNRYDREVKDLFSVQDDITRNVAGALAVEVTRVERERASNKPTESLESYDYVLRGWALLRRDTRSANFEAREMFERAIEMDPDYAAAYAGLAKAYLLAVANGWTEFIVKSIERSELLARRALALDPGSVDARRLLAHSYLQKGEYDRAAGELRRVLDLNPSDAEAYKGYGGVMLWSGQEEAAIEWLEAAMRLDPNMETKPMSDLGIAYYLAGRYEDAVATSEETLRRTPDYWATPVVQAAAYAQLGRPEEAARAADHVRRVKPFFTIDSFVSTFPDPEDAAHMADGLKKAGLPASAKND